MFLNLKFGKAFYIQPSRYLPFPKRSVLELISNTDKAQQNQYIHLFLVALCNLLKGNVINTKKDYISLQ